MKGGGDQDGGGGNGGEKNVSEWDAVQTGREAEGHRKHHEQTSPGRVYCQLYSLTREARGAETPYASMAPLCAGSRVSATRRVTGETVPPATTRE